MKKKIKRKGNKEVKMRSSTLNFRPQNTDMMLSNFSIDEIFSFTCKCLLVKFPNNTDEFEIEEYLNEYLQKKPK